MFNLKGFGDFEPDYSASDRLDDYLHARQQELIKAGYSADKAWQQAVEDAAENGEF